MKIRCSPELINEYKVGLVNLGLKAPLRKVGYIIDIGPFLKLVTELIERGAEVEGNLEPRILESLSKLRSKRMTKLQEARKRKFELETELKKINFKIDEWK